MAANGVGMKTVDGVITDIGFGRFQLTVIVLCGLVQASDLLEIQYVSMVSQKLQCVWWISDYWKSFITSGTFLGLFVGALVWGPLADKNCRRTVTSICMGYIVVYGCLTAMAPNIVWVVILRFLVGTGIGGVQPLCSTMMSEFMPADRRGFGWFLYQSLWCLGGLMEIGLAWLLLDLTHGWRYLAVLTAVPMLIMALPWLLWLPPSPRQSLLQGRLAETRLTLDRMADTNRRPRFTGDFDVSDLQGKHKRGSVHELLQPKTYLRVTIQLAVIFFTAGFSYYGLILLNVQVPLLLRSRCQIVNSTAGTTGWVRGLDRTCHSCAAFNYVELLVPTMADTATALLNALIFERLFGRRVIMVVSFSVSALLIPLLSLCMATAARIALFFVIRFFIVSGYNYVGLYVVEVYPTTLRSTAAGFHSSFSRIASILVPFVAQIFVSQVSLLGGLLIFSCLLAAAAICAALLPLETKDRPMPQTEAEVAATGPPPADEKVTVRQPLEEATSVLRSGGDSGSETGKAAANGGAIYGSVSTKAD